MGTSKLPMIFGPWFETELYSTGHTAEYLHGTAKQNLFTTDKRADLSASASFLNMKDRPKIGPREALSFFNRNRPRYLSDVARV
jgi:hypothetical protein